MKHDNCSPGEKSWYSYQQDIATKQSFPLTDVILAVIDPVFQPLATVEIFDGWKSCRTQNPNKALNQVIQGFATKEQYISPLEASLTIGLGVFVFNNAM